MKRLFTTIFASSLLASLSVNAQSCNAVLIDDNFSSQSPSWTLTGSSLYFGGSAITYDDVQGNQENRAIQQLSRTLSNSYFKMEMTLNVLANPIGNGSFINVGTISENSLDLASIYSNNVWAETDNNGIGVMLLSDDYTDNDIDNWYFLVESKLGTARTWDMATRISLNSNISQYFIVLERLSASECKLSVYSDVNHTLHIQGSPQMIDVDAQIDNLGYFQTGSFISTNSSRTFNGSMDDLSICDDISPLVTEELPVVDVKIYPNPTNGIIHVASEDGNVVDCQVIDASGKLLLELKQVKEVDLASFQNGVYFIAVLQNQRRVKTVKVELNK